MSFKKKQTPTLDEVLEELVGNGRDLSGKSTQRILFWCALANASDAVEIVAISFILPFVQEEFSVSGMGEGYLTAVIFLGMMIGGWVWGGLSDKWGRTGVLSLCLFVNFLFSFLSAFSPDFSTLLFLRFGSGIGVGGSIPVLFSYCSEFLAPSHRSSLLSLLALSWPIGALFVSLLAYFLLPPPLPSFSSLPPPSPPPFSPWRVFLIPCSLPALIASLSFLFYAEESVKFLFFSKKFEKAAAVLNHIMKVNGEGRGRGERWGEEGGGEGIEGAFVRRIYEEKVGGLGEAGGKGEGGLVDKTWQLLFDHRYAKTTFSQASIYFCLSFSFYGCYEFLPSYFDSLTIEEEGGGGEMVNPYLSSVISALAQFPGVLLTYYILGKPNSSIDCGVLLAGSMFLSCICLVFGGAMPITPGWGVVFFFAIFSGCSVVGWTVLDVLTPSLSPTSLRSTSYGLLCAIGRVGAVLGDLVFGFYSSSSSSSFVVPMVVSSIFLFMGAIGGILLPSVKGKEIH